MFPGRGKIVSCCREQNDIYIKIFSALLSDGMYSSDLLVHVLGLLYSSVTGGVLLSLKHSLACLNTITANPLTSLLFFSYCTCIGHCKQVNCHNSRFMETLWMLFNCMLCERTEAKIKSHRSLLQL